MERKVAKGLTESKRNTELGIRIVAYIMVSLRLGDGQQIFWGINTSILNVERVGK